MDTTSLRNLRRDRLFAPGVIGSDTSMCVRGEIKPISRASVARGKAGPPLTVIGETLDLYLTLLYHWVT